jgi:hypothetical protein
MSAGFFGDESSSSSRSRSKDEGENFALARFLRSQREQTKSEFSNSKLQNLEFLTCALFSDGGAEIEENATRSSRAARVARHL